MPIIILSPEDEMPAIDLAKKEKDQKVYRYGVQAPEPIEGDKITLIGTRFSGSQQKLSVPELAEYLKQNGLPKDKEMTINLVGCKSTRFARQLESELSTEGYQVTVKVVAQKRSASSPVPYDLKDLENQIRQVEMKSSQIEARIHDSQNDADKDALKKERVDLEKQFASLNVKYKHTLEQKKLFNAVYIQGQLLLGSKNRDIAKSKNDDQSPTPKPKSGT